MSVPKDKSSSKHRCESCNKDRSVFFFCCEKGFKRVTDPAPVPSPGQLPS